MVRWSSVETQKSFVAITGASRGLGRCIALQFGAKFPPDSGLVLMARNLEALESVKSEMISQSLNVKIVVRQYDQGNTEDADYFNDIFTDLLSTNNISPSDFEQFMIVHNCANIGDVSKHSLELSDAKFVQKYFDVNLTGMILLNTSFFRTFSDSTKARVVVNMTSAVTSTPLPTMHLYCAGKASRDMFMRVLAVEDPSLRILTFAPGASDTDGTRGIEANSRSKPLIETLKQLRNNGKITFPETPISKLVQILEENSFENAVYVESDKLF
ncbi:sepiapterin reductase-like [Ylistrum balloti]|uniref:sepiapterin reductase-like n=1 Tax=Ylistrum balloti TaxID=509963 RepID=UPI002905B58E|nr:sepiapterin reductase-like [Ylistrum balloti]